MSDVKTILAAEAKSLIDAGQMVVIDTRLPFDYFGGRIRNAVNLPAKSIETRRGHVPPGVPLLIVAESDDQGESVARQMHTLGFADVTVLSGGMDGWADAGFESDTISAGWGIGPAPSDD